MPLDQLGACVTKTLTRQPREGNPPPRLVETPSGMLNSVGLQNMGLEPFLREKLPALRKWSVPVLVSILGESEEEVAAMVPLLEREPAVAGIELNLSCPNIKHARLMVAQDAAATESIVRVARRHTAKPILAKLSPDVTDLAPIAQAAERAGATALTISNTFTGMSVDPATRRSRLGALTGGLSGPAIHPLSVYRVWYTAQSVGLPIIGAGGVVRAEDAVEFLLAGASAVAVGTANFADPQTPLRVLRGLAKYMTRQGIPSIVQLRGALQPT